MGCALQIRRQAGTLPGIRQIGLNMAGAVQLARLAPRQRDQLAPTGATEVAQGGVSYQPGRARDDNLLGRHRQNSGSS